jgi:hypothetical protein
MNEGRRPTTRKKSQASSDDRMAVAQAAAQERAAKSQMALIGGIGGGVLLLIIIIVAAASSGGSRPRQEERRKAAAPPPVEKPVEKPKPTNYVRNTGAIVFVCVGPGHEEKEVLFPHCPKCSAKNAFEVDIEAGGYRCTKCKTVTSDLKCGDCGKVPRVTKLKKILATAQ